MKRSITVKITPGVYVVACRVRNRRRWYIPNIRTVKELHHRLRQQRKQLLGSGLKVDQIIRCDSDMEAMAEYLGKVTTAFLRQEYAKNNRSHVEDDWCYGFYLYSLHLLMQSHLHGCLDDLIELAQAYEISYDTNRILWTEELPTPLAQDAGRWCMEHDAAPTFLTKCVTAALAVLLGVMPEPNWEEDK